VTHLVRIAISVEAFDAIVRTLPVGSVGYENKAPMTLARRGPEVR
jgi:hypothetical protein